jgi:hypothetical protein
MVMEGERMTTRIVVEHEKPVPIALDHETPNDLTKAVLLTQVLGCPKS